MSKNRLQSLDSLRGLASLTVVIHHTLLVLPLFFTAHMHKADSGIVNFISNSPFHMLWGGHEAVILFFLLSGFVLSLPFLDSQQTIYTKYLTKRFCRIYIPYIVSIGISALLFILINPYEINNLSSNFQGMWSHKITLTSIVSFVMLIGYDSFNLNGVTWSLVHELRISFFFPIIMVFIIKFDWKKALGFLLFISLFLWAFLTVISLFIKSVPVNYLFVSFGSTFYYTCFFVIGAILAKYKGILINKTKQLETRKKVALFIAFIILYNIEWVSFGFGALKYENSFIASQLSNIFIDFTISISVVILFVLVLSSTKMDLILSKRIFFNLGKISYSLYLIHIIVLLTMVHTLIAYLPLLLILIIVPPTSILLAFPFYHFVEKPAMELGKYLTLMPKKNKRFDRKIIEKKGA